MVHKGLPSKDGVR